MYVNVWVFLGGAFLIGVVAALFFLAVYHVAVRGEKSEDYDEEWW